MNALNDSALNQATSLLLAPGGLDLAALDTGLGHAMGPGIDYADLYFQRTWQESWILEDGDVKEAGYSIDGGVGVRTLTGEKTGFAYSNQISADALADTGRIAAGIARSGQRLPPQAVQAAMPTRRYADVDPLAGLSAEDKIAMLKTADRVARAADPRITQVSASLSGVYEVVMVRASDGTLAADIRPLVRFNVSVIAVRDGRRERGSAGGGGRYSMARLRDENVAERFAKEAVRQAMVNLEAVDAPAGQMPVVLGNGWPGILLHEAVGHGLEGDFNRKGSSAFAGRIGERVAAPGVTVVDDGTLSDRRGSLSVDDEGTPTQRNTLIEDGILKGYMQDKLNARLMGMAPTGNARRESYAHVTMPRMTNTCMMAGQDDPEDIVKSVKRGIYAVSFGGGQVDITSGRFVFSASEAYLIEDGKITAPVKGATLIGNGPEVMQQVSMIGHDLDLDTGIGVCGKEGQGVPVGVGQPTLKIDELTVGGTQS
ncbi:metalloprotease TldD [Chromohalobacter japonicus]|uniref:Metalloprotease TldD n=2 Tax=Chromohalobacter TaxID=42054 RepID=A0A1Q8TAK9_9GAMM|nr:MULTISPECIES: metalloprotease TldD [Chromohalobacter]MCK0769183.1 metalloprotease TldD [Chromohalobacter canadensis]MCT8469494.1 metalloprotease TldD [Chromohalobacter canadensis]MCT8472118.1 metalloprotease TldD [Chromohalobacter canadensis]MCT8499770.1 metalloprotease TldD [Chromohalobacter canadensis]OLO10729.1 metalloprotease TldD [Chromohalobacter japonicus]